MVRLDPPRVEAVAVAAGAHLLRDVAQVAGVGPPHARNALAQAVADVVEELAAAGRLVGDVAAAVPWVAVQRVTTVAREELV